MGDPLPGAIFVTGDETTEPAVLLSSETQAERMHISLLFRDGESGGDRRSRCIPRRHGRGPYVNGVRPTGELRIRPSVVSDKSVCRLATPTAPLIRRFR